MLQVEDEVSSFGAGQVAEGRSLMRKGRDGGSDIGSELGCRDHAIAIQIGAAIQSLQQRPGKYGVAVGSVVRNLLVRSAGGKHLPSFASRDLVEVILRRYRYAAPREGQAAVAGVHHEQRVLGGNSLRDVLEVRHGDRAAFEVRKVGVPPNAVAKFPA